MALSRKQYDMAFQLSAKLNSDFSGTFSRAQKVLNETQREIIELNKLQSDISAYERQKQAVSDTERKLSDLQRQYDNIQREMEETGSYSSDLENKLIDKQRAIDKTAASLEKETSKLDEMERELQEAGVDTAHLGEKSEELAKKQDQLAKENQQAADSAKDFGSAGSNAFEAVGSALVAAGIAEGLKRIYEAYKECVSIAADFHETLSAVEAISGASAEDMEILQAKAKELGATTKFTATESAEAMTYMAMAGWDATQMVSGMDGVMQLAAASGEDLAQVSDIVTDNLTAFGMKAEDTAHFADVLAAAATNSNTSVGIMGETFKNCAPLAGALGYTVEDVAVAIGLMANAGIKGSNAGTALKNIFNGLLGEITLTGEAIGEVTYSAVKSDGTMKSFGETLDDLRYYFAQMTGAEKMANAEALVGQRAMAGFVQLMNSTGDDVDKLTKSINNCSGAAEKMAKIRMDNLNGQITLMNSAADALKTTIGDAFAPELQKLAKIGTDVLSDVNSFLEKHPILLKYLLGLVAAVGSIVLAYTAYNTVKKIHNAYTTISTALKAKEAIATGTLAAAETAETVATEGATVAQHKFNAALLANPIGIVLAAMGAMVAYLADYAKQVSDSYMKEVEAFRDAIDEYKSSLEGLADAYDTTIGKAEEETRMAMEYLNRLEQLQNQGNLTNDEQAEYNQLIEKLSMLMPDLNLELDTHTGLLKASTDEIRRQIEARRDEIRLEAMSKYLLEREEKRIELQLKYNEALKERDRLQSAYESAYRKSQNNASNASYMGGDSLLISSDMFSNGVDVESAKHAYEEQEKNLEEARRLLEEADGDIETLWNDYFALSDSISKNNETLDENSDKHEENNGVLVDTSTIMSGIITKMDEVTTAYEEAYTAAYESITGQYQLWDKAAEVVPKDIDDINTALETQTAYWDDYNVDLSNLLGRTGDIEGLAEVIAHFADGSTDSVNAIAGMAAASDEDLQTMVDNWLQVQQMQQEAADTIAAFDVEKELEGVQDDFETAIENMDMSDVARTSAQNTMEAYIEALRSGTMDAVRAAGAISGLVENALNGKGIFNKYHGTGGGGGGGKNFVSMYASGTDYADPGWALVGEHGPELMRMHGGEQVYTAAETARIIHGDGGGSKSITVAPVIQISGANADADELIDRVATRLVPIVLDAVHDDAADAQRGAYV